MTELRTVTTRLAELLDEHARTWRAVGNAEMRECYDPNRKYTEQEAREATKALSDEIEHLHSVLAEQPAILRAEFREEIERLMRERNVAQIDADRAERHAKLFEEQRDRLRKALQRYGRHDFKCELATTGKCTCGLCAAFDGRGLNATGRPCTCHPDDNPPRPCPQKYALSECRRAAVETTTARELTLADFGYAPGNYIIKCLDCGAEAMGCDKRATRCAPCASKAMRGNRSGVETEGR